MDFPGTPFHTQLLIYIWLVLSKCWLEEMMLSNISSADTYYPLQSNDNKKSALSSTQEFLNIQNSGFLPSQHLLISRYSAVLFQTPHIIENLSIIETTYCDCLSLFSSFFL